MVAPSRLFRGVGLVFLSLAAALLPARDRERLRSRYPIDLNGATLFAGLFQLAVGPVWAYAFLVYAERLADFQSTAAGMNVEPNVSMPILMLAGPLTFFSYLLTPIGLVLGYIAMTGLLRLIVLATVREPMGDPPLCLVLWGVRSVRRESARRAQLARLGPERPDRILREAGSDLVVISCREKSGWNDLVTIQAGNRFYRLLGVEERQDGPHRAIAYLLSEADENEVVRALVRCEMPEAPSSPPTQELPPNHPQAKPDDEVE